MKMHWTIFTGTLLSFSSCNSALCQPLVYPYTREADVMWSKRVWRVIDLREKINLPLYYPVDDLPDRISLFRVIQKGILSGKITRVYDFDIFSNEFGLPLSLVESVERMTETIYAKDPEGNPLADENGAPVTIQDTLKTDRITQYWIKEDWFFDKQRSVMEVRIIALAPVMEVNDESSGRFSYKPLFWLYYPACRNFFASHYYYNPWNDAGRRNFDEMFQKRFFSSYVRMESNVYNRPISSYAQGEEALLESERIKESIFKFEEDLWHR